MPAKDAALATGAAVAILAAAIVVLLVMRPASAADDGVHDATVTWLSDGVQWTDETGGRARLTLGDDGVLRHATSAPPAANPLQVVARAIDKLVRSKAERQGSERARVLRDRAASRGGGRSADWTERWNSEDGVLDAGEDAEAEVLGSRARGQAQAASVAAGDGRGLWVRGDWFTLGFGPWAPMGWNPLCGGQPLASALGNGDTWWRGSEGTALARSLFPSPNGRYVARLLRNGDLQVWDTESDSAAWSASAATGEGSLPTALHCTAA